VPDEELQALLRDAGHFDAGDPERPFPVPVAAPPVAATVLLYGLARALRDDAGRTREPIAVQERMLGLARAALGGARGRGSIARRASTRRDHAERVEALRLLLARSPGERHDLATLARRLHTSAFHLARTFRAETGTSIHRHLVELRLRLALERLAGGERDLSALAHELGFADHSHLTRACRRHLGSAPSVLRSALAWAAG
jgi:AraC family transcriptional regulator